MVQAQPRWGAMNVHGKAQWHLGPPILIGGAIEPARPHRPEQAAAAAATAERPKPKQKPTPQQKPANAASLPAGAAVSKWTRPATEASVPHNAPPARVQRVVTRFDPRRGRCQFSDLAPIAVADVIARHDAAALSVYVNTAAAELPADVVRIRGLVGAVVAQDHMTTERIVASIEGKLREKATASPVEVADAVACLGCHPRDVVGHSRYTRRAGATGIVCAASGTTDVVSLLITPRRIDTGAIAEYTDARGVAVAAGCLPVFPVLHPQLPAWDPSYAHPEAYQASVASAGAVGRVLHVLPPTTAQDGALHAAAARDANGAEADVRLYRAAGSGGDQEPWLDAACTDGALLGEHAFAVSDSLRAYLLYTEGGAGARSVAGYVRFNNECLVGVVGNVLYRVASFCAKQGVYLDGEVGALPELAVRRARLRGFMAHRDMQAAVGEVLLWCDDFTEVLNAAAPWKAGKAGSADPARPAALVCLRHSLAEVVLLAEATQALLPVTARTILNVWRPGMAEGSAPAALQHLFAKYPDTPCGDAAGYSSAACYAAAAEEVRTVLALSPPRPFDTAPAPDALEFQKDAAPCMAPWVCCAYLLSGITVQKGSLAVERWQHSTLKDIIPEAILAWDRVAAYSAAASVAAGAPVSSANLARLAAASPTGRALPKINTLVDVYNTVSYRTGLSMGCYDLHSVRGDVVYTSAVGDEYFAPLRDFSSFPDGVIAPLADAQRTIPGDPILRDATGNVLTTLCKQSISSACTVGGTTACILVVFGNATTPLEDLRRAADDTCKQVREVCGGTARLLHCG
eukprot:TRINITY_DN4392_c0_g3_i1.p1 TRINITY_DN4392_c0_g3~~TRINITY_DN4392_c0_g3_i1.p1  ORF type:complete len:802 (+),score=105.74 TRINITY_DN4392_c0_g3_i1:41-2446(+)